MYLFIDTETTGRDRSSDRIVQIAWILASESGREIRRQNRLIKPSGFEIPPAAERIHGISTAVANKFGVPLREALLEFLGDFEASDAVVGHNLSFDLAMLRPEFFRENLDFRFDDKPAICTMRASAEWCRLPKLDGRPGFKWPRLDELYFRLFGRYFQGAHDALSDVLATKEAYFELIQLQVIHDAKVSARAGGTSRPKKPLSKEKKFASTPKVAQGGVNSGNIAASPQISTPRQNLAVDVFSWDWSASGEEKIVKRTCPSCRSNCSQKINERKRTARCLTCLAEYSV
jgi:DNA polymerase III epsilon subunit-like protein